MTAVTNKPVALVTGASTGIGKAAAEALVDAGFEVVGTSRNTASVTARGDITFLDLDVTRADSIAAVVDHVMKTYGRIDVVVNNAGIGVIGAAEESSIAQANAIFDVNVFGTFRMMTAVLPIMRAQKSGRIVNLSSVLGFIPAPYMALYAATKHAIEGYSESVDHEVRDRGIRVILIEPAYTKTGFEAKAAKADTPLPVYAAQRKVADTLVSEAMADGDDRTIVAKTIVEAATDSKPKLRYTTGSTAKQVRTLRRIAPETRVRQTNSQAEQAPLISHANQPITTTRNPQ